MNVVHVTENKLQKREGLVCEVGFTANRKVLGPLSLISADFLVAGRIPSSSRGAERI